MQTSTGVSPDVGFHPPAFIGRAINATRSNTPRPPDPERKPTGPRHLEVFAVGTDHAQVTWSRLGPGEMTFAVDAGAGAGEQQPSGTTRRTVAADGGPGAVVIDGLPRGAQCSIVVAGPGLDRPRTLDVHTLVPPPGAPLTRVATVSDAHVGSTSTGYFHTLVELPPPPVSNTERALNAALGEAASWGAAHLVVKGDLVDASTPEFWALAERCLATATMPVHLLPGNHEYASSGTVDPDAASTARGLPLTERLAVVDAGPLRLVLVDDGEVGTERGRLAALVPEIVDAAAGAPTAGGALVLTHHQLQRWRMPTYIPPGIPGPEGRALCRALGDRAPRVMVTSGHTHRHRRRTVEGIVTSEVGSTRDFPGTWAGYELYEGGLVQTTYRIAEPSVIRWTDYTRRSALGLWPRWAAGTLDDRCFTVTW